MILLTDGVTIAATEPAEDIVARLEAEAERGGRARSKHQGAQSPWPCPKPRLSN